MLKPIKPNAIPGYLEQAIEHWAKGNLNGPYEHVTPDERGWLLFQDNAQMSEGTDRWSLEYVWHFKRSDGKYSFLSKDGKTIEIEDKEWGVSALWCPDL